MKRKKGKYRFYIWDYLWWLGERSQWKHRIDGSGMLMMYAWGIFFFPPVVVSAITQNEPLLFWCLGIFAIVSLGWMFLFDKVYGKKRSKAVMKHYANRNFSHTKCCLVYSLPLILWLSVGFILAVKYN